MSFHPASMDLLHRVCRAIGIDPDKTPVRSVTVNFTIDEAVFATVEMLPDAWKMDTKAEPHQMDELESVIRDAKPRVIVRDPT